jgi:WD40 repeat protein
MGMSVVRLLTLVLSAAGAAHPHTDVATAATYSQVHAIFSKNCLACHDAKEADGDLVLETYDTAMAGGQSGKVIVAGDADASILVQQIEHRAKPFMPPPKKAHPLTGGEIATIRSWIAAGAPKPGPGESIIVASTQPAPHVEPTVPPVRPVRAMAYDAGSKLLAVARGTDVELRSGVTQALVRKLGPHTGHVNDIAFSGNGLLVAASGLPGRGGEVRVWNVADGTLVRSWAGHADAIYSVAVSPDGKLLVTGSYDQKIILWNIADGTQVRILEGHNGAVFALAFRPDGKVLASGSADRTVKLWDVATGKRLDTRPEPLKEQQTLAFNPDGSKLFAAGVDNRVRAWQISAAATEGSNTLLDAHFVHEGTVLRLAVSPNCKWLATSGDDRAVKLWDATDLHQLLALPMQPDWPSALAFVGAGKTLAVGRLDGSVAFYDVTTGKIVAPPKPMLPELTGLEPRGIQQGTTIKLKLTGKNLTAAEGVMTAAKGVTARILPGATGESASVELTATADAALGPADLQLTSEAGKSVAQRIIVDDLPQIERQGPGGPDAAATFSPVLPVTFGGQFNTRGEAAVFAFEGHAGQTIVLDSAAKRLGSKAALTLALLDSHDRTIVAGEDFDGDPIIQATLPADGRYSIRVTEQTAMASAEHFYRVSAGDLHVVTGAFPLAGTPGQTLTVRLLGFNLPAGAEAKVTVPTSGQVAVPVGGTGLRIRRQPMVAAGYPDGAEQVEREPNDKPQDAMVLAVPGAVSGTISAAGDTDLYRFHAKAGQELTLETSAAQQGSPVDTRLEVLWPNGAPVQRLQLRAVRDSWINFRGIDANQRGARLQNWEEMDLNQFVYIGGEVVCLYQMPRGPDSDLLFFPAGAKRRCYFGTSATTHALEEKAYIVEPHDVGETLPPNGLPVFPAYYTNDDDELREIASDSRVLFKAPQEGDYLVRVTDTRGFGGERYVYRLIVRPSRPDFAVSLEGLNVAVSRGAGRDFTAQVRRIDGFDGPVRVDITNVPAGFTISSPLLVEAGHSEARGTIYAAADALTPDAKIGLVHVSATADVNGQTVQKPANDIGPLTLGDVPQVTVRLEPDVSAASASESKTPGVIELVPGQRTRAWLKVKRNKFAGRVTFDVANLPFGVIVSDIGLSGVLIAEDQTERQIFLECAPWVHETLRPCFARANEAGNPTSPPVLVHVAPSRAQAASN